MIKQEDVFRIGKISKCHGLKGEVELFYTSDLFDQVEADYLICEVDGIYVPFFIEDYRFKNDEIVLVKFKRIDSDKDAEKLCGCEVYMEHKQLPADHMTADGESLEYGIDFYLDYTVMDADGTTLGIIDGVDDSTANVLFSLTTPTGGNLIIPATDEFIIEINDEQKTIKMELPEGLLDLD